MKQEVLNKKEGGVGQCSKALIGSTRGAPSTPQLRQERRSGTFPRTVIPQCLILFCISVDRCSRSYRSASCTSSSLGCVVQEVLGNLFLSSEEVYRICMFVASLCYSALVYSSSSQFTSSVSVVAPLNGSEGCGESRPEDSSTRHELQEGPSMVGRKQQAFFITSPCRARIERVGCGGFSQSHSSEIGSETRGAAHQSSPTPLQQRCYAPPALCCGDDVG